jgi:hypothetical protein
MRLRIWKSIYDLLTEVLAFMTDEKLIRFQRRAELSEEVTG